MAKRMLIDASHAEETRVVVADGTRLEEFDFESAARKQLKGNVYLAKVMRVEPSLQAAFVDYGGNRHGFLPFNEIHPDYYQIPVEDREALYAEQEQADDTEVPAAPPAEAAEAGADSGAESEAAGDGAASPDGDDQPEPADASEAAEHENGAPEDTAAADGGGGVADDRAAEANGGTSANGDVEVMGGDELDDMERRRLHASRSLLSRRYRIQEVIRKRQILLVQVVKEERGNKGAALTTYLSLAGRYIVLMPNAIRGGGISRKIVNADDRRRLKKIMADLDIPARMAVIVRTAGLSRSKTEIRRDLDYLLRRWQNIRDLTMESTAPCVINEEANLIRRSIRDLYTRDIEQILIEGDEGYKTAKTFMKTMIPSHAARVKAYRDRIPLFARYQIESQLDSMYSPELQLKSGGYLVIDPTEALVAIDVNSGRATRERTIEETALKTNLEAAEEVARQLRLRDLAGLIVIDFIDMDENRNQRAVERKLKEAMRVDRARIRMGRISPFGLMELSRQRLRPSLVEASMERCTNCGGHRGYTLGGIVCGPRTQSDRGGGAARAERRDPVARAGRRRSLHLQPQAPDAGRDRAALRLRRQLRAGRQPRAAELRDRADRGPASAGGGGGAACGGRGRRGAPAREQAQEGDQGRERRADQAPAPAAAQAAWRGGGGSRPRGCRGSRTGRACPGRRQYGRRSGRAGGRRGRQGREERGCSPRQAPPPRPARRPQPHAQAAGAPGGDARGTRRGGRADAPAPRSRGRRNVCGRGDLPAACGRGRRLACVCDRERDPGGPCRRECGSPRQRRGRTRPCGVRARAGARGTAGTALCTACASASARACGLGWRGGKRSERQRIG